MLDTRKTSAESADPVRRGPSSLSPSECHPATHYTAKLNVGIISGSGYKRSGELVTARELESRYKASARRRRSSTRAPGSRDYSDTRSKADTAASTTKVRSERDKGAPIVVLFFRCSSLPDRSREFSSRTMRAIRRADVRMLTTLTSPSPLHPPSCPPARRPDLGIDR